MSLDDAAVDAIARTRRWQCADGLSLVGDEWGDPNGPLVVLLHGGGQTRHAWKGVGARLGQAGYWAIAFDARGHGDSDWSPDGAYGQDAMVEDLHQLIQQLGGRPPALVGASLGGGTALVAIGEGIIEATALVLVDTAPQIEPAGSSRILDFMAAKPEGFDSLEEVAGAIAAYQPHRPRPTDLAGLMKNLRRAPSGKYRWHWDPDLIASPIDFVERFERLSRCSESVTVPTLLVRGAMSDVISEEGARHFQGLCRHAEYVNIADAGHMIAGDRNDIFGSAVLEFLRRAVPVTRTPSGRAHIKRVTATRAGHKDLVDLP